MKAYGRHISCSRRTHSSSSGPDPGPPRCQLEVIVKVFLADGAGRHAGDIAAMQESACNTTLAGLTKAIAIRVYVCCAKRKKWVLTKNTWTSEQRVGRLWRAIPMGMMIVPCGLARFRLLFRTRLRKRERKRSREESFVEKTGSRAKRKKKDATCAGRNEIKLSPIEESPEEALGCRYGDSLATRMRDWQLSADVNDDHKYRRPKRAHNSWTKN